jgi:hypothetical protein
LKHILIHCNIYYFTKKHTKWHTSEREHYSKRIHILQKSTLNGIGTPFKDNSNIRKGTLNETPFKDNSNITTTTKTPNGTPFKGNLCITKDHTK